jgi:hypothetical protein
MCGITDGEGAAFGDVSAGSVMCGITDGEDAGVGDGVSAGCVMCGITDGEGAGFGGGLCPSCCATTLGVPQKIITETTIAFRLLFMTDRLVMGAPKKLALPTPC